MNHNEYYKTKSEIKDFFKEQGIKYLNQTKINCERLLSKKIDETPYYLENKEYFDELSANYFLDIETNNMAPVYIKKIDPHIGYGVFAAEDIEIENFIGEYAGVVQISEESSCKIEEWGGYDTDFTWYYPDKYDDIPELELNGRLQGNEMRYINHSFEPNVDVEHTLHHHQWILFFKASKYIKKDEQLFINYGKDYWEDGFRDFVELE